MLVRLGFVVLATFAAFTLKRRRGLLTKTMAKQRRRRRLGVLHMERKKTRKKRSRRSAA